MKEQRPLLWALCLKQPKPVQSMPTPDSQVETVLTWKGNRTRTYITAKNVPPANSSVVGATDCPWYAHTALEMPNAEITTMLSRRYIVNLTPKGREAI